MRYPKTNVDAATDAHPTGPSTIDETFEWANVFLQRLFQAFGKQKVKSKLRRWRWSCSTVFTGIGCAEQVGFSIQ